MAENILTQILANCQGISTEKSKIFTSKRLDRAMAAEILNGPISKAVETLRIFGFNHPIPIPECVFMTAEDIAKFYDVNESHIRSLFVRYSLTRRTMPEDIKTDSDFAQILRDRKSLNEGRYEIQGYFTHFSFLDKADYGRKVSEISIKSPSRLYSARICLAVSALMCYGKTIPLDSVGQKVYNLLLKTNYFHDAMERIYRLGLMNPSNPSESQPESQTEPGTAAPEGTAPISTDGTVSISLEGIKSVVGETMSEFAGNIVEATKSSISEEVSNGVSKGIYLGINAAMPLIRGTSGPAAEPEQKETVTEPPAEQKPRGCCGPARTMPENWKRECRRYWAGKISKKELSERTGIPYNSIYGYMNKW